MGSKGDPAVHAHAGAVDLQSLRAGVEFRGVPLVLRSGPSTDAQFSTGFGAKLLSIA